MKRRGRPLRFIAAVLCAWTSARVAILWPQTGSLPEAIDRALPVSFAEAPRARRVARARVRVAPAAPAEPTAPPVAAHSTRTFYSLPRRSRQHAATHLQFALASLVRFGDAREIAPWDGPALTALVPQSSEGTAWRGAAWLYMRDSSSSNAVLGSPQLGGGQAGLRLLRPFADDGRAAFAARAATPLSGTGAEVAAGLSWRPFDLPVEMVAEQRIGLDHQPGGPATAIVGGSGPAAIGGGFVLETYGEAGAVFRGPTDYYAAGAAQVSQPVGHLGDVPLSLGLGAWASAQRNTSRIDIGPSISLPLPVSRDHVRLSLDWRQRLAGDARPGSGPALTIGTDF